MALEVQVQIMFSSGSLDIQIGIRIQLLIRCKSICVFKKC